MDNNTALSAQRTHIGFFGTVNAGKSSLVNAVTGQNTALVSSVRGTTTDPVRKSMELLPLGPVVIIDTPGFDDNGELGMAQEVLNILVLPSGIGAGNIIVQSHLKGSLLIVCLLIGRAGRTGKPHMLLQFLLILGDLIGSHLRNREQNIILTGFDFFQQKCFKAIAGTGCIRMQQFFVRQAGNIAHI